MTETLAENTCTPCRGGIPPLTRDEAQRLQAQAPNWEFADDTRRIERTFRFRNFREVLALFRMLVSLPRLKVITSTSVSAGVMRPSP
jgi:4a-hydroxytetrahydrobiopterin dehydratase